MILKLGSLRTGALAAYSDTPMGVRDRSAITHEVDDGRSAITHEVDDAVMCPSHALRLHSLGHLNCRRPHAPGEHPEAPLIKTW